MDAPKKQPKPYRFPAHLSENKWPDVTGRKFGRLTAEKRIGRGRWIWKCDCGERVSLCLNLVSNGNNSSCGCIISDGKHGFCPRGDGQDPLKRRAYAAWVAMKSRCLSESNTNFKNYGGRGISICEKWVNSFSGFVEDVGIPPTPAHTIGRIDNESHYKPGNVRWETRIEQQNNNRRNVFVTHQGLKLTQAQWARRLGMPMSSLRYRVKNKIPLE